MTRKTAEFVTKIWTETGNETDRSKAILISAAIDDLLRGIILAFLADDKFSSRLLSGSYAPIGTFKARLDLCLALGLIDDYEHNECDIIRKVRNEFAHKGIDSDFDTPSIRDRCQGFVSFFMLDPSNKEEIDENSRCPPVRCTWEEVEKRIPDSEFYQSNFRTMYMNDTPSGRFLNAAHIMLTRLHGKLLEMKASKEKRQIIKMIDRLPWIK